MPTQFDFVFPSAGRITLGIVNVCPAGNSLRSASKLDNMSVLNRLCLFALCYGTFGRPVDFEYVIQSIRAAATAPLINASCRGDERAWRGETPPKCCTANVK